MKVALIGASGAVGSRILSELSHRGHTVTAIARHPDKILATADVTPRSADIFDENGLTEAIRGHDAVISAIWFTASDPARLINAVRRAAIPRYLVVGGAGSLEVSPGLRLHDSPEFPAEWIKEAKAGGVFLDQLRQSVDIDWTFLSPSAVLSPGERTGHFRLGGDQLLRDASGNSAISMEDYAVAMVDELERPAHSRRRFTVGY